MSKSIDDDDDLHPAYKRAIFRFLEDAAAIALTIGLNRDKFIVEAGRAFEFVENRADADTDVLEKK